MAIKSSNFLPFLEPRRDEYGFTVRPQHLQRYREYANIYKEEEDERLEKWTRFLGQQADSSQHFPPPENSNDGLRGGADEKEREPIEWLSVEEDDSIEEKSTSDIQAERNSEKEVPKGIPTSKSKVLSWAEISPSLHAVENIMSLRIKKRKSTKHEHPTTAQVHLPSIDEVKSSRGESEDDGEEEFYDNELLEDARNAPSEESAVTDEVFPDSFFPLKQELEFLVQGGVPRDLRGEVWQAFVGVRTRRVERHYQNLLDPESGANDAQLSEKSVNASAGFNTDSSHVPEKLRKQIEKDLARTFPGHPALDENGRSSLRRVLLAYARHNPSVGYCQAMNFFAGLLLLMMPEENAFWALVGILDDYFGGYYSEKMIESQVDQLVFEELMRQRFPKLVNHLDYLGVQVAWISGPWFLTIFVNILPWESVLRIWDVLLFEGNRVMLFRSALALMELYGPTLVTTKDAGDAITLLQSLAGSTFDSSQLVLTACMGFLAVTEDKLQELREKHRPAVVEVVEERFKGEVSKKSKGLATKLASFKHGPGSVIKEANAKWKPNDKLIDCDISNMDSAALDKFLSGLTMDTESGSVPDIQEQVVWLKVELCKLLEEKRSAILRAEELETALMEMVKQDNRRQLSAKVEQLEEELAVLRQALSDKKEQENAMLQLLMRVEQEQKVTEDARIIVEQDAAAQKFLVQMLEEKYEKAKASIAEMEKRVVMAESMLEATLQYEHGQGKAISSPRAARPDTSKEVPTRKLGLLSFGLGWRGNKGQQTNAEEPSEIKSTSEGQSMSTSSTTISIQPEPGK